MIYSKTKGVKVVTRFSVSPHSGIFWCRIEAKAAPEWRATVNPVPLNPSLGAVGAVAC